MDIQKEKCENNSQFIWRVCSDKSEGIIDITWKELAVILNKELFDSEDDYVDESALRKQYQYAKKYYDDVFSKMSNDEYLTELHNKTEELKKERYKLNTINAERNKNLRTESRQELLYESIKNYIEKLPTPDYEIIYGSNIPNNKIEYILTIADVHAGAVFKSENNEYSLDICKERFEYLLEQTISFIKNKDINHLNILELGDSIQGILRLSDIRLNESSVVEATVFVARQLSIFLNSLSKYCEIDYYHTPTSNHSQIRPLGSSRNELGAEDIEYIISNYIKDSLIDNKRVKIHLNPNQEYISFNILGYDIIALHGHQIKNITSSLKDLSILHRTFYDIIFLAHFHASSEMSVGECITADSEVIICPSFVGSDPYSDSILKGSKSACKIFGISEYGGHIETYKFLLN